MDNEIRPPAKITSEPPRSYDPELAASASRSIGTNGSRPAEQDIDWQRWAWVLWRRKWWIIAATALGTCLAIYSARGQKPVYQATARVWVEAPDPDGAFEVTNVFSTAGWIDLLQSYSVLENVVEDLGLYLRPGPGSSRSLFGDLQLLDATASGAYKFRVRRDGTYILSDLNDNQIQKSKPGEPVGFAVGFRWVPPDSLLPPGTEFQFAVERPRDIADRMSRALEISVADPQSNFIALNYRGTNPVSLANILNTLLDRFVGLATELKRQKHTELAATLEDQLELSRERLHTAERELESFRINTIDLPDDRRAPLGEQGGTALRLGDPVFDRYFALHEDVRVIQADRAELATIMRNLEETGELEAFRLEAVPAVASSSQLMAALEELARLEVEYRQLSYRYTPEHNEVERIVADIDALETREIPALVVQLSDRLASRERQLNADIRQRTAELKQIPTRAIEEEQLRRKVDNLAIIYNDLHQRYQETQVAEAATQPSVRILDRAFPPAYPIQNTARLRIILGFILSLGLALGGVIAHARFVDRRIHYAEQVVQDLGLPILGVVPNLRALAPAPRGEASATSVDRMAGTGEAQTVVESFRALRTQLTLGLGIEYPAVIAITSPSQGEGKSLITSNLALAFADRSRSTILIDGDVRRGRLHRVFGFSKAPGLSEYLRGEVEPSAVVKRTDSPGLFFLPRGRYTDEVPELLDGEGLPALLAQLKQTFQVILIDTPPLAAGVDAVMIGAYANAVIAVLRKGRTDMELARGKIDSYARMLGIPIVGAILNDVDSSGPYRYYTYSYAYEVSSDEDE